MSERGRMSRKQRPPGRRNPDAATSTNPPAGGSDAMAADETKCDPFPDLYRTPSGTPDEKKAIEDGNALHQKLYSAVAHILVNDFRFNPKIPHLASGFPGTLSPDDEQPFFLGVYGLLLADNWQQPS